MSQPTSAASIVVSMPFGLRAARNAAVMYLGALLIGLALVSVPSSSAYLKSLHGFSDRDYGGLFLPQLLCAIAGALLAGPAVRRMSLKAMFLAALVCFLLSQLALAQSANVGAGAALVLVMVSTGLFGFGFGFGGGPLNGLVANLFPARSAAAITALHFMAGVGLMLGPLLFRKFEMFGEWSLGPCVLAVTAAALFVVGAFSLDAERSFVPAGTPQTAPSRSMYFWLMLAIAFFYALVEGAFSNWAVIYVAGEQGQSADVAAAALSIFWGGLTLGRLLVTLAVTRMGPYPIWVTLPLLMIGVFLALPTAAGPAAFWLAYGAAGLACSAFFPLTVAIAARPYPEHVSWIASMLTASLMLGVGTGSYAIGALLQSFSMSQLYRVFALVPAIALVLMIVARRSSSREQVHAETGYSRP